MSPSRCREQDRRRAGLLSLKVCHFRDDFQAFQRPCLVLRWNLEPRTLNFEPTDLPPPISRSKFNVRGSTFEVYFQLVPAVPGCDRRALPKACWPPQQVVRNAVETQFPLVYLLANAGAQAQN